MAQTLDYNPPVSEGIQRLLQQQAQRLDDLEAENARLRRSLENMLDWAHDATAWRDTLSDRTSQEWQQESAEARAALDARSGRVVRQERHATGSTTVGDAADKPSR